jgi:FAD binding domain
MGTLLMGMVCSSGHTDPTVATDATATTTSESGVLPEVTVTAERLALLGTASAASEGAVDDQELELGVRTQIGAGPARMFLALLLRSLEIECIVVEQRDRAYVGSRVRAGVLEHSTVELMHRLGAGERVAREGLVHRGTNLAIRQTLSSGFRRTHGGQDRDRLRTARAHARSLRRHSLLDCLGISREQAAISAAGRVARHHLVREEGAKSNSVVPCNVRT